MIEAFQYINKAFESKVRLGIMAILMVNEEADFNFLKEQLSLTDGNLASHTRALEELGYIIQPHTSAGRIPSGSACRDPRWCPSYAPPAARPDASRARR